MKRQADGLPQENTWMANKHVIKYSTSSITEKWDVTAPEWPRGKWQHPVLERTWSNVARRSIRWTVLWKRPGRFFKGSPLFFDQPLQPWYLPKRNESTRPMKDLYQTTQTSAPHCCQKLETVQLTVGIQIKMGANTGIVLSKRKTLPMKLSQKRFTERKKPDMKKYRPHDSIYIKF